MAHRAQSASCSDSKPPVKARIRSRKRTVLTPNVALSLPAPIFMEWRGRRRRGDSAAAAAAGEPQDHHVEGVLLYMDNDVVDNAGNGVFTVFLVPQAGLMFFSSLTVAETVLRGTTSNVTGWSCIRACVAKPPQNVSMTARGPYHHLSVVPYVPAWLLSSDTSSTSSSSSCDENDHCLRSSNSTAAGATRLTPTIAPKKQKTTSSKETDTAWLERRLARHARKEHKARLRHIYEEQRAQEDQELARIAAAGASADTSVGHNSSTKGSHGRRQKYFTLHSYRAVVGGPGFTNATWMHAHRQALVAKVKECTSTSGEPREQALEKQETMEQSLPLPNRHNFAPLSCPSFM